MKAAVKQLAKKTFGDVYNTLVLPKHLGVAVAANLKRGFPARKLRVIGVTGTNGKTSTAFLIHSILYRAGYNVGLMTTVAYGLNDEVKPQIFHMTTQPIEVTLNRIMQMKKQGVDWLVIEVTSQALSQFRVLGIPIEIAVMTNVSHEHLDYHRTFERYLKAKLRLFKIANRNRKGRRLGIINGDDDNAALFADAIANVVAYSTRPGSDRTIGRAGNIRLRPGGSSYSLKIADETYEIACHLPGSFNVENSLAAALVGRAIGLNRQQIEDGVAGLKAVEGRMTSIQAGQDFDVIVDFAHTPDSFKKLFTDIRPLVKGKLISVFGSGGQRDRAMRPIKGQIAGQYSDLVIVTEDNPRSENCAEIMKQIAAGAAKAGKKAGRDLLMVEDRRRAIEAALKQAAGKDDMVLLLGKGHEKTMHRNDGEHPWNEIEIAEKAVKKLLRRRASGETGTP